MHNKLTMLQLTVSDACFAWRTRLCSKTKENQENYISRVYKNHLRQVVLSHRDCYINYVQKPCTFFMFLFKAKDLVKRLVLWKGWRVMQCFRKLTAAASGGIPGFVRSAHHRYEIFWIHCITVFSLASYSTNWTHVVAITAY